MSQSEWEKNLYKAIDGLTRFAGKGEASARPERDPAREGITELLRAQAQGAQAAQAAQGEARGEAPPEARETRGSEAAEQSESRAIVIAKNALNGGEISPYMGARFDQARFQTGCHKLLNMVPLPCGGATKRPGFKYMGLAGAQGADGHTRLVPFIFSATETRLLEFFGDGEGVAMRVWRIEGGGDDRRLEASEIALRLPWKGEWLAKMSFCQSADVVYIASEKIAPAKISRYSEYLYKYETIKWAPDIEPPTIRDGHWIGASTDGAPWIRYEYKVTAIDKETGEESAATESWGVGAQALRQDHYVKLWIRAREDIDECRVYKRDGGVYGYIGSTRELEGDDFVFEDKNIAADTADTPPEHKNPFDGENKYPSLVFLHQQRLGFASSRDKPLTVWLSPSGNYESMAASLPPDDDDAIEATLATSQANRILWAVSDRRGLAIGTSGGEWVLAATGETALSPKNVSFEPQSAYGSEAGLSPLQVGSALLFVQRGGRVVRDLSYNYADDRYQSSDLSILARHMLAESGVRSWAWQAEPYGIAWMATNEGALIGMTYLREHEIVAWHRHETAGQIEALATLPAPEGDIVLVALISRLRGSSIARHVEILAPYFDGHNNPWHKDGIDMASYPARCVPCIGIADAQNGSSFGRPLKINAAKVRVLNSKPFSCRVISQYANPGPARSVPARPAQPPVLKTTENGVAEADWSCPIGGGFRDNARLELILDGPDPATILGIAVTLEIAQSAGGQL